MTTVYYDDLLRYAERAYWNEKLNIESPTGYDPTVHMTFGDPHMEFIPTWGSTYSRAMAGFSNAIQQLWYGSQNPKQWQAKPEFDCLMTLWDEETWLTTFLLHRVTGSGASFSPDHGFRNSIIADVGRKCGTSEEVIAFSLSELGRGRKLWTSIGNQPPAMPKPLESHKTAGAYYLSAFMRPMILDLLEMLRARSSSMSIQATVDWLLAWNVKHGLKKYAFVYTAFACDLAEYFPKYVDPWTPLYLGNNARESFELCGGKLASGIKGQNQHDKFLDRFQADLNDLGLPAAYPMSLEDITCDAIRHWRSYIPQGYEYLRPWQHRSSSSVAPPRGYHPSYQAAHNHDPLPDWYVDKSYEGVRLLKAPGAHDAFEHMLAASLLA